MNSPDALQLLVICHAKVATAGDFPRGKDYVESICNSFVRQEANELVRELSLVDEQGTGAAVRRFYVDGKNEANPLPPDTAELAKALHTLVVLLVSQPLAEDDVVVAALDKIARRRKRLGQATRHPRARHLGGGARRLAKQSASSCAQGSAGMERRETR